MLLPPPPRILKCRICAEGPAERSGGSGAKPAERGRSGAGASAEGPAERGRRSGGGAARLGLGSGGAKRRGQAAGPSGRGEAGGKRAREGGGEEGVGRDKPQYVRYNGCVILICAQWWAAGLGRPLENPCA